jgi:hypothetical protein
MSKPWERHCPKCGEPKVPDKVADEYGITDTKFPNDSWPESKGIIWKHKEMEEDGEDLGLCCIQTFHLECKYCSYQWTAHHSVEQISEAEGHGCEMHNSVEKGIFIRAKHDARGNWELYKGDETNFENMQ